MFRYLPFLLFLLAFLPSSAQVVTGTLVSKGLTRDYRLYVPAIYDGSVPVPLILNLHGYGSQNWQQELYGDFRGIADTANFLVVHPNGTMDGSGNRFWNAFGTSSVDDVAFMRDLIDTLSHHYNIDPNAIFSTGMSNGGYMSYQLACDLGDRIAAIASVTGSMLPSHMNNCGALHPTPVMQIHGTSDGTVPYNGNINSVAIPTLVSHWVNFNQCNSTPVFTAVPDINTNDGCTAEHYVYSGGLLGTTMEFYKIVGGDHSWPGAPFNINITNMDFSASQEIWRFFRPYRLNQLFTDRKEEIAAPGSGFLVGPNPSQGSFNLKFQAHGPKQVVITNALGQLVWSGECIQDQMKIELKKAGIYFVTAIQGDQRYTERVVVE